MRNAGKIFIAFATFIVMLHSITPHQHHQVSKTYDHSIAEVKNDSNLINWLQFIFHPDLGEDHLEKFQNENPLELSIPDLAFMATLILFTPDQEEELEHHTPYIFSLKDSEYLRLQQQRGPPALV